MDIKEKYNLLTRTPLLMGISGQDLARMEEHLKFQVETIPASHYPLIVQGEVCSRLLFLLSGELMKEISSEDGLFGTQEYVLGPTVIEAENLYALHSHYECTYRPTSQCQILQIRKHDIGTHLMKSEIFRLNYMNMLSAHISRLKNQNSYIRQKNVRQKLVSFFQRSFTTNDPRKMMRIKMTDLADYLDETRLTVSNELNNMENEGLIQLMRMKIYIPDINKIYQSYGKIEQR
ncbi:MAG: Crp/Fnr family transcriptional regulator [Bacteroidaceae bacterium]|nr:Crp/Fnr family transcriptional regulator [Bacteroidaceae bacterium]